MKKLFLILILMAFFCLEPFAQEVISGLYSNPVIQAQYEQLIANPGIRESSGEITPINLPFCDDFTQTWIYPESSHWIDEEVYINSNFGYRAANVGVATLDALSKKGTLHANASQFPFIADSLTSRPIRLDSIFTPAQRVITRADSIYFSFYYQPQGRANPPEPHDSLILQFGYYTGDSVFAFNYDSIWVPLSDYIQPTDTVFPGDTVYSPSGSCDEGLFVIADDYYFYSDLIQLPCDSIFVPEYKWKRIWSSAGMTLEEFYEKWGVYSKQVLIPITDSIKYLRKDFQFRFINYASLASDNNVSWKSNCDQWNLDYIYLNISRSRSDSVYRDMSFVERAPSMLKNYEAMPYNQYSNNPSGEMKDNLEMTIVNLSNDPQPYNPTYFYFVYQVDGVFEYQYDGGDCNLFPFIQNGFQNCIQCQAHACPPVNFVFPISTTADSAEFEIRHYIFYPQEDLRDTLAYRQKFFNYYAYDDGTPEEGYGLTPEGAKLAYRFKINVKDTLRAIQMFFNHTLNDANERYFNLMVWQDNNGKPGDVIYSQLNEKVEYSPNLLGFQTYMLEEPVAVNGIFYIGWEQLSNDNLNLGYDRFNDAQGNIYYNATGEWFQSIYNGALMMRPLLGKEFEISGIDDHAENNGSISPYPNPIRGNQLSFKCTGIYENSVMTNRYMVSIHSILGQELYSGQFSQKIDTGNLNPGMFIVTVTDDRGVIISVSKLIKN